MRKGWALMMSNLYLDESRFRKCMWVIGRGTCMECNHRKPMHVSRAGTLGMHPNAMLVLIEEALHRCTISALPLWEAAQALTLPSNVVPQVSYLPTPTEAPQQHAQPTMWVPDAPQHTTSARKGWGHQPGMWRQQRWCGPCITAGSTREINHHHRQP